TNKIISTLSNELLPLLTPGLSRCLGGRTRRAFSRGSFLGRKMGPLFGPFSRSKGLQPLLKPCERLCLRGEQLRLSLFFEPLRSGCIIAWWDSKGKGGGMIGTEPTSYLVDVYLLPKGGQLALAVGAVDLERGDNIGTCCEHMVSQVFGVKQRRVGSHTQEYYT